MSPKQREDFVWVRPLPQYGAVTVNNGPLHVECSHDQPQEVTRGEWESILKKTEVLEICSAPQPSELEE